MDFNDAIYKKIEDEELLVDKHLANLLNYQSDFLDHYGEKEVLNNYLEDLTTYTRRHAYMPSEVKKHFQLLYLIIDKRVKQLK
jgi:hypothetical protein